MKSEVSVQIPISTIFKVVGTLIAIYIITSIAPILMTLFLAILVAVSLSPIIDWAVRMKCPRWVALSLLTFFIILAVAGTARFIVPRLYEQISNFVEKIPQIKSRLLEDFPEQSPIRNFLNATLNQNVLYKRSADVAPIVTAGHFALGGLSEILLILVFTIYLIADGPNVIAWLYAFFVPTTQIKIRQTFREVAQVISAYVAGQVITSVLSFIYVFITLKLLHVPNTLLLAVLSGIFDVLPVLGFFLAVIPAMMFATTVSAETSLFVLGAYLLYHGVENYLIVPAVYGNRLKVSSFVVLLSLLCAGLIAGIEGAIAVLPVVASYPIIEKIWLKRYVSNETVTEHEKLAAEA